VTSVRDVSVSGPCVLVMGSEGFGIRDAVLQQCDRLIRIDGLSTPLPPSPSVSVSGGAELLVDSLNVSVSAGIILHQIMQSLRSSS
jgi:tRNA G18 (ribose-2'-O)-methylase SpoU